MKVGSVFAGMLLGATLVGCNDDAPKDPDTLADVCEVADLDLMRAWYGSDTVAVAEATANNCSYHRPGLTVRIIASRDSDGAPQVTVTNTYDDPADQPFTDDLLAMWLEQRAYSGLRPIADSVEERSDTLSDLPDREYPCSTLFAAGSGGAAVVTHVGEVGGEFDPYGIRADFGAGIPGLHCSDLADENTTATIDEAWPVTVESWEFEAPPDGECGLATLRLTGAVALAPDGTEVPLGDLTMTNANWMTEPPMECRRT